jgi:hypothetical protein
VHLTTAGRAHAAGDPLDPDGTSSPSFTNRWPLSAICIVTVSSVATVVLLIMNLFGLQIWDGRDYNASVGGSVAEWFGAVSTLVAIPAAVLFGVRQLQAASAAIELSRRQLATAEIERIERRDAEQARLRDAVRVRARVLNLLDVPDLATEEELTAIERLREEYRQRGWVADASGASWQRGQVRRTNAEQLTVEPSPLLPRPWFLAVECWNTGAVTVTLQRWVVLVEGTAATVEPHAELRQGDSLRRRLGAEVGLDAAYGQQSQAGQRLAAITVVADGVDATDHPFRIIDSRRE